VKKFYLRWFEKEEKQGLDFQMRNKPTVLELLKA
jgi:hypothetical protein